MAGHAQNKWTELFTQNQGHPSLPKENYTGSLSFDLFYRDRFDFYKDYRYSFNPRKYSEFVTINHYPFVGTRFLNHVLLDDVSSDRVSSSKMVNYYQFIKGYPIRPLNFERKLFTSCFDIDFEFDASQTLFLEDDFMDFSFNERMWTEHYPCKNWCSIFSYEDLDTIFIRNEIDSVGFVGFPKVLDTDDLCLSRKCVKAMNILPSLHKEEAWNSGNLSPIYYSTSRSNWIAMTAPFNFKNSRVFIEVTDYDCWNLSRKTDKFGGIENFIGKTGLIYDSQMSIPDLNELDGYRFWHWMYSEDLARKDSYFIGSSIRQQRKDDKEKEKDMEVFFDSLPDLFDSLLKDNIKLQGLDSYIGAFKTIFNGESRAEVIDSVNNIGKFTETLNSFKEKYDDFAKNEWYVEVLSYITSFGGFINGLANDFVKFTRNPFDYVSCLFNQIKNETTIPTFSFVSTAKAGLLVFAAIYLFEKSQILALGLFMYAMQSYLNGIVSSNVARAISVTSTLLFTAIMKALEPKSAFMTLQGGGTSSLTSMIYSCVTFITLAFSLKGITTDPKGIFAHLHSSSKDIFNMAKGTLALTRCVEFLVDAFNRAIEFCFGQTTIYQVLVKASVSSKDLQDYIVYSMSMNPDDLATRLTLDDASKDDWSRMCKLHDSFLTLFASGKPPTENHIGYSMYSKACSAFIKLREEFDKIKDNLNFFRVEPFMVWIWGDPGTGKTWCRDEFVKNMYYWHKKIDPTIDARKSGLLYVRNPADKYLSNYDGHFAMAYDDVMQNRQPDNPEPNEIMGMASTNQLRLNMADLADKGRMFSSKVIIMAANTHDIAHNDMILSPEAFNRRRHVVIKISRPTAVKDDSTVSTSNCDFSRVRLTITDSLTKSKIVTFPETGFGDNDATFRDFFKWLAPRYCKHVKSQHQMLRKKETDLHRVLNGDPTDSIIIIDDDGNPIETNEGHDTVDNSGKINLQSEDERNETQSETEKRQLLTTFMKIRMLRAVDKSFDESCSNLFESENVSSLLLEQFQSQCRTHLGRELTQSEIDVYVKRPNFKISDEETEALKDFLEKITSTAQERYSWFKWLGLIAGLGSLVGVYGLFKKLFSGDDKIIQQKYSLETVAPKSNNIVLQSKPPKRRKMETQEEYMHRFETYGKQFLSNLIHWNKELTTADHDLTHDEQIDLLVKNKIIKPSDIGKLYAAAINNTPFEEAAAEIGLDLQKYSLSAPVAPKKDSIQLQKRDLSLAPPSHVIQYKLLDSCARWERVVEEKDSEYSRKMNAFEIGYKVWVVPRHFFPPILKDISVVIHRDDRPSETVYIEKDNIFTCTIEDKIRDICFVRVDTLCAGPDLTKHFASIEQFKAVKVFKGEIMRWDPVMKRMERVQVGDCVRWDKPMDIDEMGYTICYTNGYSYAFGTEDGDCGSILVSKDDTTQIKIFGLHFGQSQLTGRGYSMILPREWIEQVFDKIKPVGRIVAQPPQIKIQCSETPCSLKDSENNPHFQYLGIVADAPLTPRKHKDLFRSPLYNQVYPAEKDLSVLSMFDNRIDPEYRGEPDILTRGVIDFDWHSTPWPRNELNIATHALLGEFKNFKEATELRVHTIDEALNGIWINGERIPHSEPLNLKTSAGYGLTGKKRDHFEEKDIFDGTKLVKHEISIKNPELQKMVDDQWNDWMQGRTHPCIWTHALKSEPIKLSKIKTGNTRTFCVAQTAFLINVRRLFGAFTIRMKSSMISSFSCLGVDATSADWNELFNNLQSTGSKGVDLDFFKFDRTAVTWQLALKVVEAINAYYNDSVEHQRARLIAFEDLIFSYALIGKYLTRKRRGNPSGNPLTTELNNCVNYLMLCMVFLLIAKKLSPHNYRISSWKKYINMKAYGDDLIFTVHPECLQWFNLEELSNIFATYGVPVTPADKSTSGLVFKPLHELTFLKRTFRPFDHPFVKWVGALDKTSIRSMIQFYRLKPNNGTKEDAILTNCEESFKEAYFWGKEFFDEHTSLVNNWLTQNHYPQVTITFEELDFVFRDKVQAHF